MWSLIVAVSILIIFLILFVTYKVLERRDIFRMRKYITEYRCLDDGINMPREVADNLFFPCLIFLFLTIISCVICIVSISCGYSNPKVDSKDYMYLTHELEYGTIYSSEVEKEIDYWNEHVNDYNNLWCRLTIEDRSEYIINKDAYLKKFKH